jgi:hypothetical protein
MRARVKDRALSFWFTIGALGIVATLMLREVPQNRTPGTPVKCYCPKCKGMYE